MKKVFISFFLIFVFALWTYSSDFSVGLNVSYNYGTSDFFQESELFLSHSGLNYLETKHNLLGIGFSLNIDIPIIKKVYLSPGFSINFGHQHYNYKEIGNDNNSTRDDYFFNIYSGELNLLYDLLSFKNGWDINVLVGLNYNHFRTDPEARRENEKYFGMKAGIVVKFFQLKHFGFQALVCYKLPFSSEPYSYLITQAGILYRF